MKLLLDTHTFLWWTTDDPQLSATALDLIADNRNTLYWSAASSWEVSIKYALGRLPLPDIPEQFLPAELGRNRIESLPIALSRVAEVTPCAASRFGEESYRLTAAVKSKWFF